MTAVYRIAGRLVEIAALHPDVHALCAAYRAEGAAENTIRPLALAEAYPALLRQVYRPLDASALRKTLPLLDRLAASVSLWRLGCNMDSAAGFSGVVRGNRTLGAVLELLKSDVTEAELIAAMKERFDAPEGMIEADVARALAELRRIGALDE